MSEKIWIDSSVVLSAIAKYESDMEARKGEFDALHERIDEILKEATEAMDVYLEKKGYWDLYLERWMLPSVPAYDDPSSRIRDLIKLCEQSADGRLFVGQDTVNFLDRLGSKPDKYMKHLSGIIEYRRAENKRIQDKLHEESEKRKTPVISYGTPEPEQESAGSMPIVFLGGVVITLIFLGAYLLGRV